MCSGGRVQTTCHSGHWTLLIPRFFCIRIKERQRCEQGCEIDVKPQSVMFFDEQSAAKWWILCNTAANWWDATLYCSLITQNIQPKQKQNKNHVNRKASIKTIQKNPCICNKLVCPMCYQTCDCVWKMAGIPKWWMPHWSTTPKIKSR